MKRVNLLMKYKNISDKTNKTINQNIQTNLNIQQNQTNINKLNLDLITLDMKINPASDINEFTNVINKIDDKLNKSYELYDINDLKYINNLKLSISNLLNLVKKISVENNILNQIITNFYVDSLDIFHEIFNENSDFFLRTNILHFITVSNRDLIEPIKKILPNAIINIFHLDSICAYLFNMKFISKLKIYNNIEHIYFISTKNKYSVQNLLRNYKLIENKYANLDNPLMLGLKSDIIRNIKGQDINIYKNFYTRYRGLFSKYQINNFDLIKLYLSEYIDHFYNILNKINIDYNFYRIFDKKCAVMSDVEIEQYITQNKNIWNPNLYKSISKENYKFDSNVFVVNKHYVDFFRNLNDNDYDYELKLKDNLTIWSDMFYLLNYYQHGKIITLNENGDEENIDIENFINFDISFLNEIKIPNNLIKIQSNINTNILESQIAIFINFEDLLSDVNTEKYKTIIKYLTHLKKNNINIDIYFGKDVYSAFRCNGFSLIEDNLNDIIDLFNKQYLFDKNNFNYYLGFNLIKKYNLLIISDEISEKSAVHNELYYKNLLYIVLDYKYTINKNYKYLCLSQSVYTDLLNIIEKENIFKSNFGVDKQIYINQNKERENAVIIEYIKQSPTNKYLDKYIKLLLDNNIHIYIYNEQYDINNLENIEKSDNLINLGKINNTLLNEYYNKCKIGIIFNKNPTRNMFEMFVSGLCVFVLESDRNSVDLPQNIFKLLNKNINFDEIKNTLDNDYKYDEVYSGFLNIHNEYDILLNSIIDFQ